MWAVEGNQDFQQEGKITIMRVWTLWLLCGRSFVGPRIPRTRQKASLTNSNMNVSWIPFASAGCSFSDHEFALKFVDVRWRFAFHIFWGTSNAFSSPRHVEFAHISILALCMLVERWQWMTGGTSDLWECRHQTAKLCIHCWLRGSLCMSGSWMGDHTGVAHSRWNNFG